MSIRIIADVEADIAAVKYANPRWLENAVHAALIAAYTNEKDQLLSVRTGVYNVIH